MGKEATLTIGQIAKLANVNTQTLRYYERRKILSPKTRRDSGYRVYDEEAVRTVQFIKRAQKLGFSLDDIQDLLSLKVDRKNKCGVIKGRAAITLKDVEEKISKLDLMRRALKKLIRNCEKKELSTEECPLLESLAHEEAL